MAQIQFFEYSPEQLQQEITKGVKSQFDGLKIYLLKDEIVDLLKINILFQTTTLHGLQNKTTPKTKHKLCESCKLKKKRIGLIISIFKNLQFIIQIITADLLSNYETIYPLAYSVFLLILKLNMFKHYKFKHNKSCSYCIKIKVKNMNLKKTLQMWKTVKRFQLLTLFLLK